MPTAPKVIGVEQESSKLYRAGSYTFRQLSASEYTLEQQDPIFSALRALGFTTPEAFGEHTIITYFESLERDGKIIKLMDLLLHFYDATWFQCFKRRVTMCIFHLTKVDVIRQMTRGTAAEVIQDFFVQNFNSPEAFERGRRKMGLS